MTKFVTDIDINLIDAASVSLRHSYGNDPWNEGLGSLAASISENGVLQPVQVSLKPNVDFIEEGKPLYDLVFGHRRLEASKSLGRRTVPALIVPALPPSEQLSVAIAENVQREGFTATEYAEAEARLRAALIAEGAIAYQDSQGVLRGAGKPSYARFRATQTKESERTIENRVALGEAHPDVRHAVDTRTLLESGGYSLARFDPVIQQAVVLALVEGGIERAGPEEVHTEAVAQAQRLGVEIVKNGQVYEPKPGRMTMALRLNRLENVARAARIASDNPTMVEAWRVPLSDALALLDQ